MIEGVDADIINAPFLALYLSPLRRDSQMDDGIGSGQHYCWEPFFILGAASNVIIIQSAEKENEPMTSFDFARIGIPLTILNTLVYWIFL
jgi:hypothetical protein